MDIPEILQRYNTITVVGLSRDETKYSYIVAKYMQEHGYKIIPINPFADTILGEKSFKSLDEVGSDLGIVDVFRPADEAPNITRQAIACGAKVVWLQEDIISNDARMYAEAKGIDFVQDKCIMKEYDEIHSGDMNGT